ncbi:PRC-barrel domain-containing protein [Paenibacillus dendritiformis]|uniref:PRC-barrel domain-containing protein n=1 Tax=Paenibacillus TaxID=44249 RepID=UPI00105AA737|nr:PRC-barrel domain-containing protein [Paenibacillus dendritiformis]TDL55451.1 photosystem reaction center subunit H [Paenibacillus dendritiformis]WGU97306.1 PRC-barrel domain-containing protein [Paenibacillus dendritiformis]
MKLLELIGLPVFDIGTGKQVSKVKDICITPDWKITHLQLVSRVRKQDMLVRWEDVTACGDDAVMITSGEAVQMKDSASLERAFLSGEAALKGLPVMTSEGSQLGWVADVYFQPNMGNQITGLEISDGLLADLLEGRRQIEGMSRLTWGTDVIVVEESGSASAQSN